MQYLAFEYLAVTMSLSHHWMSIYSLAADHPAAAAEPAAQARAPARKTATEAIKTYNFGPDARPKAMSDHWTVVTAMLQITQQQQKQVHQRPERKRAKTNQNQQPTVWFFGAAARPKALNPLSDH